MSRIRYSLREIEFKYLSGEDKSLLENLVRAFRGIQKLDPSNPDSFFTIAGYHGEPFRGKGMTDPDWWGGYCNHGNVLFPLWHRAYLLHLEDALRNVPGCQDVTLPFWDECFTSTGGRGSPIPAILTTPIFDLDGQNHNPLYSYKLQEALVEEVEGAEQRYSKPQGYETVRYPLSGLVGTEADRQATAKHNKIYANAVENIKILNCNVAAWLNGTVKLTDDDKHTPMPDTYSIFSRFKISLDAPNYTVFSNNTSAKQWIADKGSANPHYVVALESPHNAIHLAVGGFYSKGNYNADTILGANGDMGDNETAGFDPIFFFHHAFVDYVFWKWQMKNKLTSAGDLQIIPGYAGTISDEGLPDIPPKTALDLNTPLYPFQKPDGNWYTGADVTDIDNQLDYQYGPGSLDPFVQDRPVLGQDNQAPIVNYVKSDNIDRAQYAGSFVVRTYARGPGHPEEVEIGRDPILSRWNVQGCANCQSHLGVQTYVPLDTFLLSVLKGDGEEGEIQYRTAIHTHDNILHEGPGAGVEGLRTQLV